MLNLYWVSFVLQLKLCTTILLTNRLVRYSYSDSFLQFLEGPNLNSLFSSDSLFGLSTQVCGWGCPQLLWPGIGQDVISVVDDSYQLQALRPYFTVNCVVSSLASQLWVD